jgi:DNA-binding response OmpR family regulator
MRILLVEDDEALGEHIARGLREENHILDIETNGLAALHYTELLQEGMYDVSILDVVLPGCDGMTVCREWRRSGLKTPVLMLTARRSVDDRVAGLDVGADDYLTKPFAFAELLARVRALGRREPEIRMQVLHVADLSLDPVRHRVERGGHPVELTPREYRILELLLRHPGQVMSRDQIAERAWEMGAEHASNVVDVFMHTLRRKIDTADQPKLLHTIRGAGYTLREPAGRQRTVVGGIA